MARKLKQARWSYAKDRRQELAKSSKSPEEIARLMSRSPAAVYKMAIRLGVPLRPVRPGAVDLDILMGVLGASDNAL